jgi:hypothetical protein
VTLVVAALVSGIQFGLKATAEQAVKDAYQALKAAIVRKYGNKVEASIEQLERQPLAAPRQKAVAQELRLAGADQDGELLRLAGDLTAMIDDPLFQPRQPVLVPTDPIEQAQRQAGSRAVGHVLERHINSVMDVRSHHMVDDTD